MGMCGQSPVPDVPLRTMSTLASFLRPEGYGAPSPAAVAREGLMMAEATRFAARAPRDFWTRRGLSWTERVHPRADDPVILVPGFMAGDSSLALLAAALRREGFRTYRSQIRANVGCTLQAAALLETRLESIAIRRDSRVQIVGHSLGGLLARGLAVRRPDLISGIVTLGSPLMAPAAHHVSLTVMIEMLNRLSRAGLPGVMAEDCVAGTCALASFTEASEPIVEDVRFTSVWSPLDGIVDPQACRDPLSHQVKVRSSHCGMAFDPKVRDVVVAALRMGTDSTREPAPTEGSGLEAADSVGSVGA